MANRTRNAKKNIVSGVISKVVSLGLPFLTRTCIIYLLGSMYLGLNSLFASILHILSLAELGFGEAMVFSMYKPLAEGDTAKVRAILALYRKIYRVIGVVILAAGIALLPFLELLIRGGYPDDINVRFLYIVYLLNTVLSYMLFAYKGSLLTANQQLSVTNNIGTVVQASMSLVQIALIVLFRNYYFYAIAIPVFTIIRNLITDYCSKKLYPEYFCEGTMDQAEVREIGKRVAGLFIYKVCGTFRSSFDSIVISAFLGLIVLAKYENYFFIANSIIGILTIISSGITAGIGNSMVTETKEKNYRNFFRFFFMYEWISGWCTACLFCLYQPFMEIWVGEELMMGSDIVVLMCCYFFVLKAGDMCYVYRQAAGIWWTDRFRPMVEAAANLALNLILVQRFGAAGVLLATVITMVCINFVWGGKVLFDAYFEKDVFVYYKKIAFYAVTTAIAIAVTYGVCALLPASGIIPFAGKMAVCCVVPNLCFLLMYGRTEEFRESLPFVRGLISGRRAG